MKRLPDLLIVACVSLLVLSMSALSQTKVPTRRDADTSTSSKTELPKLIVRSAAKGLWAAVRLTSQHVVYPATEHVVTKAVEEAGPKLAKLTFRTLTASARGAARAGKLSLDHRKARLPL